MVYAVIDTNVLVSARISKNPLAATVQVVASMFQNKIIPVYNDEILSEYDEVLHRPNFKVSEEQIIFLKRSGWQMAKPLPTMKFLTLICCTTFYLYSITNTVGELCRVNGKSKDALVLSIHRT